MRSKGLVAYKVAFGLLGLSAIATEIVVLMSRDVFAPANFFSFFTIQSNLFATAVLIASGVFALKRSTPNWLGAVRGAATLYMLTTGIIFAALLSGLDAGILTAVPWDNTVLHYIMPFAMVVDWLLDPPKALIPFKRAALWLIYPAAYLAYTLVRGPIVGWYPYPFLNPANSGCIGVALVCVGVAVTILTLTWIVARVSGRKKSYKFA